MIQPEEIKKTVFLCHRVCTSNFLTGRLRNIEFGYACVCLHSHLAYGRMGSLVQNSTPVFKSSLHLLKLCFTPKEENLLKGCKIA